MKNKTNCKGLYDNYKRMLEQLTEWENAGGYIYDTDYAAGELPYHGYEGERLKKEQEIASGIINAYNKFIEELKNAIGE